MLEDELSRQFAKMLTGLLRRLAVRRIRGLIADEDDFSSQFVALVVDATRRMAPRARWSAISLESRRLKSKGPETEESKFGADVVMVLDVDLPDLKFNKGMLIQAKVVSPKGTLRSGAERKKLIGQCNDMLNITPASFVLGYSSRGVLANSASAIAAGGSLLFTDPITLWVEPSAAVPRRLVQHSFAWVLFYSFFRCWVGDPRLNATDRQTLERLRERTAAKAGVVIKVAIEDDRR